jgi:peptide-methionine (S)-S-oxide reductase
MWFFSSKPESIPSPDEALPGRDTPIVRPGIHTVLGTPIAGPWPEGTRTAIFGLGCFWGAEKAFWELPGVVSTSVGYAGGSTPNPTYEEACSGRTGHAEVVQVAFDPAKVSYERLLKLFWEYHDPTQGMRQGNDRGTQYRSIILTAEIRPADRYFYAEEYHQQYLDKVPNGYCPNHATGVKLPDDFVVTPLQYVD